MTPRLTIRPYHRDDHQGVWDLHNRALHAVGAHAGNGEWDADLHAIDQVYVEPGGVFLVGESDGAIVAMGAIRRLSPREGEVARMRVEPARQRQGLGRAMLTELEAFARKAGLRRLRLTTTTIQTGAQAFYERAGYQRTGTGTEAGFDTIHYAKPLD